MRNSTLNRIQNPILKVIYKEMQDRGHSINFLAQQIGVSQQNLDQWFTKKNAGIGKLVEIMNFYDLDIVKIKKYRVYEQMRDQKKVDNK